MRKPHEELTLFPDMVELPVHQFSDFCLQGCAGGAFDCSGTVLGYMKFYDVEEQPRLSPKISVDQAFGTSRARRDLTDIERRGRSGVGQTVCSSF